MALSRYIKEAFAVRPWGMLVSPNWVGIGGFILLGLLNWGLWIVGGGLELGFVLLLATNPRFQRWVDAKDQYAQKKNTQQQILSLIVRLGPSDQARYRQLEQRCQRILGEQHEVPPAEMQTQADGLGKLLYVYLRLLITRAGILRVLEGGAGKSIDVRMSEVTGQIKDAATPELQKSLHDQLDILTERKKRHGEAWDKLQFIEAELTRIQEQVELIRESMVMAADSGALSRKIDTVGQTLGATTQWIKQQQELFGQSEDLLDDAPPVALDVTPSAPPTATPAAAGAAGVTRDGARANEAGTILARTNMKNGQQFFVLQTALVMAAVALASGQAASQPAIGKFTISPETTIVDGPLNKDGTINYIPALNKLIGEGVKNEENAALPLMSLEDIKFVDQRTKLVYESLKVPLPPADYPRITNFSEYVANKNGTADKIPPLDESIKMAELEERLQQHPWKSAEHPDVMEWLKASGEGFKVLEKACTLPKYFVPFVATKDPPSALDGVPIFTPFSARESLAIRAMLRAGEGDVTGAMADIRRIQTLARMALP